MSPTKIMEEKITKAPPLPADSLNICIVIVLAALILCGTALGWVLVQNGAILGTLAMIDAMIEAIQEHTTFNKPPRPIIKEIEYLTMNV